MQHTTSKGKVITLNCTTLPVAQPRQRHRVITGKNGKAFAANYTPKGDRVNQYKADLRKAASESYDGPPLDTPLHLVVRFLLPRTKAQVWKNRKMPRLAHTKKPDIDNLLKSTKDALTGILWRDDCLIASLDARKQIAAGDEQPGVSILVRELEK